MDCLSSYTERTSSNSKPSELVMKIYSEQETESYTYTDIAVRFTTRYDDGFINKPMHDLFALVFLVGENAFIPHCKDILLNTSGTLWYDILSSQHDRVQVCKEIIKWSLLSGKNANKEILFMYCVCSMAFRITYIFANDLFAQSNKLRNLLEQSMNNESIQNALLSMILENRLMIKYILSRSSIWKPLFNYLTMKSVENRKNLKIHILAKMHKYWKLKHVLYLINSNLMNMMVDHLRMYIMNSDISTQSEKYHSFKQTDDINVINLIIYKIEEICKENDNISKWNKAKNVYLIKLNQLSANFNDKKHSLSLKVQSQVNFTGDNVQHFQEFVKYMFGYDWYLCGYIYCQSPRLGEKNGDTMLILNHPYKYGKCKGCKLVTYCCRNHQKKDWKLIHSQQCLRNHIK